MPMRPAVACLILAAATAAQAAGSGSADKTPKDPKDPRVCRSAPVTGTRITSSECHLQSEWVEIDAARHSSYEEFNRRINSGSGAERAPTNSPFPR